MSTVAAPNAAGVARPRPATAERAPALQLSVPADYLLRRDACSYGYFLLAPNLWEPAAAVYWRVLDLPDGGPARLAISQPAGRGSPLRVRLSRPLSPADRAEARRQVARMLRLDVDADQVREFHRADPRWKRDGRGRLMRSPTLFEDVIKTVTSCNVQWPSTVVMNRRLCEVVGRRVGGPPLRGGSRMGSPPLRGGRTRGGLAGPATRARGGRAVQESGAERRPTHAFPTPERLARVRPATLRARCRAGYRDARIVALAKMFARGQIRPDWFEDPATSDEAVWEALLELPGIGPYAAANIMQLLGRYSRLPLDTESIRHGRTVLGLGGPPAHVMRQVHAHFAPFGRFAFLSYWLELWAFYESRRGPAWEWDQDAVGASFTASQLG